MIGIVDVEFENVGWLRQTAGGPLCEPQPPSKTGQDKGRALFLCDPGGVPGNRIVREHTCDQQSLPIE